MPSKASKQKISLGIVGFGNMGRRHWQALRGSSDFDVSVLVDSQGDKLPQEMGFENLRDYRDFTPDMAEAVLVAAPSSLHAEMGLYFLDLGLPLFMEKPLALSLEECRVLSDKASSCGVAAMVGMVERFNPGFVACLDLLRRFDIMPRRFAPQHFVIERFNPASAISDSDVIVDLMVHDLDILLSLVGGAELQEIRVCEVRSGRYGYDYVSLVLIFAGGVSAEVRCGRGEACGEARRYWGCEWDGGKFGIDFLRRRLDYFEHLGESYMGDLGGDALLAEHRLFADIIGGGENILGFDVGLGVMELLFLVYDKLSKK